MLPSSQVRLQYGPRYGLMRLQDLAGVLYSVTNGNGSGCPRKYGIKKARCLCSSGLNASVMSRCVQTSSIMTQATFTQH